MKQYPRFCVIGAGNGGLAMAGHLAIMGVDVVLWNRSAERLEGIKKRDGIEVAGAIKGFGKIKFATTNIEEALSEADVIMVVIPATGHSYVARLCAPYLRQGQIIVLNPGRTGGALEFADILSRSGISDSVILAETQTFLYASRAVSPYKAVVKRIKNSVPIAALPAYLTPEVLRVLKPVFRQFIASDSILDTSLDNIGAIFHPALLLLNATRIEQNQRFDYYIEGATPYVTNIIEAMDKERIAVASALGVRVHTAREWLYLAYDAVGKSLYEALQKNSAYNGILAPATLNHRYITEDVPASLVPIASIGNMLGIPTPSIESIIHLACVMHKTDYRAQGRTVEKLGIMNLSVREIRRLALEGNQILRPIKIVAQDEETELVSQQYAQASND